MDIYVEILYQICLILTAFMQRQYEKKLWYCVLEKLDSVVDLCLDLLERDIQSNSVPYWKPVTTQETDSVLPETPSLGLEKRHPGKILDTRYQKDLFSIWYGLGKCFLESTMNLETIDLNLIPNFVTIRKWPCTCWGTSLDLVSNMRVL